MTTVTEPDATDTEETHERRRARRTAGRAAALAGGGADGRRPAARRRRRWRPPSATRSTRWSAALQPLAEEYDEQGRGFELRNVAGGWRYYTREEYAAVVEAFVLEGQQARLTQAALETLAVVAYKQPVVAGPGLGDPRGQRRRRDAHPAHPRPGRGGRRGPLDGRPPLPHHELLPGADRRRVARRAARAGALPARPGRLDMEDQLEGSGDPPAPGDARAGEPSTESPTAAPSPRDAPEPDDDGLVRLQKLLAQSGVASRRKCEELMLAGAVEVDGEVVTRLGTKVDPRTAVIRVEGQAAAAGLAARLPRAEQAARRRLHDVRPGGPAHAVRRRRRPARAALPRRAPRHRHRRAAAPHQRRRLRPAAGPPVVRGGQDLRRRGRPARSTKATLQHACSDGVTLDDGPVTVSAARLVQRRRPARPSSSW